MRLACSFPLSVLVRAERNLPPASLQPVSHRRSQRGQRLGTCPADLTQSPAREAEGHGLDLAPHLCAVAPRGLKPVDERAIGAVFIGWPEPLLHGARRRLPEAYLPDGLGRIARPGRHGLAALATPPSHRAGKREGDQCQT
jgi:hypothetical protein